MRWSKKVRTTVAERANYRCEYCKIHEDDMFLSFDIDHIIAQKHGGGDEIENLSFACPHCNQHKGTDLTTFVDSYNDIVQLYNPRKDFWEEHFETNQGLIIAKTKIATATIKLLKMNDIDLVILRGILSKINRFP